MISLVMSSHTHMSGTFRSERVRAEFLSGRAAWERHHQPYPKHELLTDQCRRVTNACFRRPFVSPLTVSFHTSVSDVDQAHALKVMNAMALGPREPRTGWKEGTPRQLRCKLIPPIPSVSPLSFSLTPSSLPSELVRVQQQHQLLSRRDEHYL